MIDITPQDLALIRNILRAQIPNGKIWVFGSRARGETRRGSDLDLAIDNSVPLSAATMALLAGAFEEAPLAYKVDLIDLHTIDPQFRALIDTHKIALPDLD